MDEHDSDEVLTLQNSAGCSEAVLNCHGPKDYDLEWFTTLHLHAFEQYADVYN